MLNIIMVHALGILHTELQQESVPTCSDFLRPIFSWMSLCLPSQIAAPTPLLGSSILCAKIFAMPNKWLKCSLSGTELCIHLGGGW